MFNNIYKKFKEFIRSEWKFLLVLAIIIFITNCPVNCYVITGGGTISATDRVDVEGSKKSKGSFHLAYVSELKGTIYTYLLSYIIPSYERESLDEYKYNKNESEKDIQFRNNLLLNNSLNNAIYVAYNKAEKKIEITSEKMYVYSISDKAKTSLQIGDEIVEVDGKKINNMDDIKNIIKDFGVNDDISMKVVRDNEETMCTAKLYIEGNQKLMGVLIMKDYNYKFDPKLTIKFKKSEGGPSGGLMLSLEVYNQLSNTDITKGKTIVGTGTIDRDGNVGEIDGVKYKLKGAEKENADVFIAPAGRNYKEAVKEKKKNKYKFKIIEAKTFDQVIEELNKLK